MIDCLCSSRSRGPAPASAKLGSRFDWEGEDPSPPPPQHYFRVPWKMAVCEPIAVVVRVFLALIFSL